MARKVNTRNPKSPRPVVIGAGITEYWYLKHLKKHRGYKYILKPSLFGDESMLTIQNHITEGINSGSAVVCIFDEDVKQWNQTEKQCMVEIHRKYDNHPNVIIASSMPSIEYWLLLHYENTNRYFGTSTKVIDVLKKYIVGFEKREHYLKQDRWLISLIEGNKMETAYARAKTWHTWANHILTCGKLWTNLKSRDSWLF